MPHQVGSEVDAFCTRCRLMLAHTILAMVGEKVARVRCNTCGGDHGFRSPPGSRPAAAPREARQKKVVISFQDQLAAKDLSRARRYSPTDDYQLDEVINHPSFGLGIVVAVRPEKVDVAFKAEQKTLVHRRGEPRARPAFHPPNAQLQVPADKPAPPDALAGPSSGNGAARDLPAEAAE